MLAVCPFCGITAEDFNYCVRCKRKLPDKVKAVVISNDLNSKKEKYILVEVRIFDIIKKIFQPI